MQAMRAEGLPVDALQPQGAIYASTRFALQGRRTPEGTTLRTDDDIRRYLLHAAQLGAVPFGAFGARGGEGWFRLSVGVASVEDLRQLMPRLRDAVTKVI